MSSRVELANLAHVNANNWNATVAEAARRALKIALDTHLGTQPSNIDQLERCTVELSFQVEAQTREAIFAQVRVS